MATASIQGMFTPNLYTQAINESASSPFRPWPITDNDVIIRSIDVTFYTAAITTPVRASFYLLIRDPAGRAMKLCVLCASSYDSATEPGKSGQAQWQLPYPLRVPSSCQFISSKSGSASDDSNITVYWEEVRNDDEETTRCPDPSWVGRDGSVPVSPESDGSTYTAIYNGVPGGI